MTIESRRYTQTDESACRWIWENKDATMRAPINSGSGGFLTLTMAQRLELLNLIDGNRLLIREGGTVRLSGIGVNVGRDAIRRGVPTLTVIP